MAGALKTLFTTLQTTLALSSIQLVYGEEEVNDQSIALPMVVMVPKGGQYREGVGYSKGIDVTTEMIWGIDQNVDFYIWANASSGLPIDNVDAVEPVRQALLSALQVQRETLDANGNTSIGGLYFKPTSESWGLMQGAFVRFGRALIVSTVAEISVPTVPPPNATVTSESITYTVTNAPS